MHTLDFTFYLLANYADLQVYLDKSLQSLNIFPPRLLIVVTVVTIQPQWLNFVFAFLIKFHAMTDGNNFVTFCMNHKNWRLDFVDLGYV